MPDERPGARRPVPSRRPLRDNPRLILLGILILLAALVAMVTLADRAPELNPDFLTEVLLYALSAADLAMLLALGFLLARNIVKLLVERRRGLPFSRFRAKLVGALLGLTIIPALLVLIVGSELIRSSTQKWMSQPIDGVLASARHIAAEYYKERETAVVRQAGTLAARVSPGDVRQRDVAAIRQVIAPAAALEGVRRVDVYDVSGGRPVLITMQGSAAGAALETSAATETLAARVARGSATVAHESRTGGELVQAGALVTDAASQSPVGVVVVSEYLTGTLAAESQRIIAAYEEYSRLLVLRRPLQGMYLSLFLMMTLMILVSATWMGLYLAKRITRPVHRLAQGAREIGAGHLDHRIEPETRDEFGSLVEAFNAMAAELAASQQTLERSRLDLERNNLQLENRRRYIETVLERIATGVLSVGADGRIETINGAALRLLAVDRSVIGTAAAHVFARPDLQPLTPLLHQSPSGAGRTAAHEIALVRDGRELHLAAAATPLLGEAGIGAGAVLVIDDVTPLIRTQRVAAWRDVARRLAHEIKNPLTPIQLCAERIRRHLGSAPGRAGELVEECTSTIVAEVESLKGLVDEFAQFARMPAPKAVPADLHRMLADALSLYEGLFQQIRIERRFDETMPLVRIDVEQIRRVAINLIDNAVEALGGAGAAAAPGRAAPTIVVETRHEPAQGVARLVVSDNGPGIPVADRDKLFMPYYSTKRRGSGLGLAIVRRIVVEHGGNVEVEENEPSGTRFIVDLPL